MRTVWVILFCIIAIPVMAMPIDFKTGWKHQRLSLFSSNTYKFDDILSIKSKGTVSIAWTRLPKALWSSTNARWTWETTKSVPPTNLAQKGGDDRNVSVYFVFLPNEIAPKLIRSSIIRLLGNSDVEIIQYTFGGNHKRGQIFQSPYAPENQGYVSILRPAKVGRFNEAINIAKDYAKIFKKDPTQASLVGLAVSADSDDTDTIAIATLENLILEK